jgi:phosphoenolpyruvate carboxylase
MIRLSDWEKPTVDVVPLFESVEDLLNAQYNGTVVYKPDVCESFGK